MALIENPNTSFGDEPLAALPSGHVITAIGRINQSAFYEYDPTADQWTSVSNVPASLASHTSAYLRDMTVLPTGQVLVTGAGGFPRIPLYRGRHPDPAWQPTVIAISPTAPGSSTSWVSGWVLNGISEGGVFGDDNSTGSNYPLVQLTDRFGHVIYATTFQLDDHAGRA